MVDFSATFFLASTREGYEARDSHPAPAYGIYYVFHHLFGGDEAALRILSILLCLASCVGIGWLAVQSGDRPGPAIVLLALSPAFIQYGNMVDFSMFTVGLAPLCAAAWFRHRYGGGGLGLFMGLGFLCGATSWYSFFLVPAIWLEILAGRPRSSACDGFEDPRPD